MPLIWQLLIVLLILWIVIYMVARWLFARDTRRATWSASFVVGVLLVAGLYIWLSDYLDDHWSTCQVTGKSPEHADSEGVIYTSNCGALSMRDTWNRQSDLDATWNEIVVGKSYNFRLAGMRLELKLVNWYPNIIDMQPAGQ